MKALVLYIVYILTTILLCSEVSLAWLVMLVVDIVLTYWIYNNITLGEFIKYSGYKTWYKFLRA